ncbi:hypothetical protein AB0L70_35340 [Kribbella sp. NPDC051952]|uniref:hypothetical protein n=1 Tax=Kribbella sp. NPDC051952 TaxID=3154851 RepID=UPI0034271806
MTFAVLVRSGGRAGRYGHYLAEICRGEGLVDHEVLDLDTVTTPLPELLQRFSAIVVSAGGVHRAEADALHNYVSAGGGLVLVQPSRLLAERFGFDPADRTVNPAYVGIDRSHPITAGFDPHPVQTHVTVDLYARVPPGEAVATVWLDATTTSPHHAVTRLDVARGQVVVFHYDLPRAVARLRHGDPDRVGSRSLGFLPYRQADLLEGHVDRSCWHLPQAEIHGRLLVNAITAVSTAPVPRWWYYPDAAMTTLVIQDSDDDWSTKEQFDQILASADEFEFHDTFYLMLGNRPTVLTDSDVADLRASGHSFGIHHDALEDWAEGEDQELVIEQIVRRDVAEFERRFGRRPLVNRNHCLVWQGYVDLARLWSELGVRMDFNAQGMGDAWLNYTNGSSRPLRYVDLDGTVIDTYQQPTQVFDDLSLVERLGGDPDSEAAAVADHLRSQMQAGHGPLSMQSHPVSFATYSAKFFRAVWRAARALGVQIWSAEEWARHTLARDSSTVRSQSDQRSWTVTARGIHGRSTLMIPVAGTDPAPAAVVDGHRVLTHPIVIHGITYLPIPLEASEAGIVHSVTLEGDSPALRQH